MKEPRITSLRQKTFRVLPANHERQRVQINTAHASRFELKCRARKFGSAELVTRGELAVDYTDRTDNAATDLASSGNAPQIGAALAVERHGA